MSAVRVQVDVSGLGRVFKDLELRMDNVPKSIISEGLITAIDDEIESKGRGRWADLSDVTMKLHPKRRGGMLLQDTGLLASMQASEGDDWVKVESPAPYAFFHIVGTEQSNIFRTSASHTMPARNFLDIDLPKVLEEAAEAIATEVVS